MVSAIVCLAGEGEPEMTDVLIQQVVSLLKSGPSDLTRLESEAGIPRKTLEAVLKWSLIAAQDSLREKEWTVLLEVSALKCRPGLQSGTIPKNLNTRLLVISGEFGMKNGTYLPLFIALFTNPPDCIAASLSRDGLQPLSFLV